MRVDARATALLQETKVMVLATVRPDGRPHAVPIWFVWHDGRLFFATDADTVKVRNVAERPEVAAVIERGGQEGASHAVIIQGTATRLAPEDMPPGALLAFRTKYAWDPAGRAGSAALFAVTPRSLRAW